MVAADGHSRHLTRCRMNRMREGSGEDDVFAGLGKDSVCVVEGRHGTSGIRQRKGTSVGRNLEIKRPGESGSRVGMNVVMGPSELDRSPAVLKIVPILSNCRQTKILEKILSQRKNTFGD